MRRLNPPVCFLGLYIRSISTGSHVEIRPYMYETLIALVSVHAQVCDIAEQLLDRTLNAIVEELANEALQCFRQVKRFGMGGMLRVTLPFSLS